MWYFKQTMNAKISLPHLFFIIIIIFFTKISEKNGSALYDMDCWNNYYKYGSLHVMRYR